MKLSLIYLIFLMFLGISPSMSQEDSFLRDFLIRWEQSRNYFIEVANAMPEEIYFQTPYPEGMNFAEQMMHVGAIIDWHAFSKFGGSNSGIRWEDFQPEGKSKKQLIQLVSHEFERAAILIGEFDPEKLDETVSYASFIRTKRQFLLLLADHVSHHRAQMIVLLRLQNIEPPNYINYQ
ncbi:DinB family protein [Cyclobacterium jeungdonense]|uniref:DinB family protein n=1 Tax=Cyclobacterium jeungdonense TaxID=708087 RepID=A0ABT8C0W1_9BACT|nr:DinB family protein [Cyclobacterium jeungdonense]MDN3686434.1 DinB family protein [Cyclobacterium jeungdonense]